MPDRLHGIGVSSGIAIGRVRRVEPERLPDVPVAVHADDVETEVERFRRAVGDAHSELSELKLRVHDALGERYSGMLEVQLLILEDPVLLDRTVEAIRGEHASAAWSLRLVVEDLLRRFDAVGDGYLRERGGDLADVHRRLQRLLRGGAAPSASPGEGPVIVVAHALGPSDAVALVREGVLGLATDVGGRTSHTAILAQALMVPAVVGLNDVSLRVRTGDVVVLDGDLGTLDLAPDSATVEEARLRRQAWQARESADLAERDLPTVTRDGAELQLRANVEFYQEIAVAARLGAAGIGLYRSEFLFLERSPELPAEEDHYRVYRELGERVAPHPAVIRTLDLGGEKYFHEVLERQDDNPALGLRAVRLCLARPDIFRPQLRALLRAAAHADIRVLVPLVTTLEEIRAVRAILAGEAATLRDRGVPIRADAPVGIMIETPAAATTADVLARESDFLSIGTNDLIQLALAVDRGNASVSYLYEPLHPSILRMLHFVVRSGRHRGIPVSLCGEMAADPRLVPLLIGLGLRELSVPPRSLGRVREAIRATDTAEARRMAEVAMECGTASEVEAMLRGPEGFEAG